MFPVTPLGLPATPPALPDVPPSLLLPAPEGRAEVAEPPAPVLPALATSREAENETGAKAEAVGKSDDFTPPAERQEKADRRTFFHTAGKPHTFGAMAGQAPRPADDECQVGQLIDLAVSDVHFGNPRVRIMSGPPAPMPTMLKWPREKFDEHTIDCARISFGPSYNVWCAAGIASNRLLYAMKRCNIESLRAAVVEPPPLADPDEDIDLTYGASIQGIQLVP
mmetsp:Transcript_11743/g.26199  ORF Transcript_11743/g.26199 Transcript_11743/m.26199 type:complete len:223 (-) Transcript_11743:135-803(-)|eukprot:CAMPEP_0170581900 /NCGR_PEP_ID=MMETSP0224-20130122/7291_1 /TAXON_ID=285029 /ORGANISM="Togula jolla, Strain CCCM 725" /LENGTH=222 /DNA_ID=CAMNT_0010905077 /DNA_START=109 /DNA_END=777 /DNA_ORIENTATION=+